MRKILYLLLFISSLSLFSCAFTSGEGSENLIIARSSIDVNERDRRERAERNNIGDCENNSECEEICEDVYDPDGDEEDEGKVERCLEVSYNIAITFEDILDILEEPYYADLREIESKDFEEFLDVSLAPWIEATRKLNNQEAEDILNWVAREDDISSAITRAYENGEDFDLYEGMTNLFKEVIPSFNIGVYTVSEKRCAEYCLAVADKSISQNQSFWEIVTNPGSNNPEGRRIACSVVQSHCANSIFGVEPSHCPASVREECDLLDPQ
ncbi:MAG: hypothetical protein OXC37_02740 [Bdellovibrionaceae bacterium]|nr:hypothetical protein [Pseudobdellovibrionaceae bacterium]